MYFMLSISIDYSFLFLITWFLKLLGVYSSTVFWEIEESHNILNSQQESTDWFKFGILPQNTVLIMSC